MPGQSNVWFAAIPPSSVPVPNTGYYAVFIADGTNGTLPGILHKKDSAGLVTAAVVAPAYTDEQAQDAVAAALGNTSTVAFTYNDAGNAITAVVPDTAIGTQHLADKAITNTKLADMPPATFKMRATGAAAGVPIDGTAAQAKLALAITAADVTGVGASAGTYNVTLYGITTSNTAAANLAAWNTLMGTVPDTATISFPPSATPYQVSGTLAIPAGKRLKILGGGTVKSTIQTTAATGDVITVGDAYTEFQQLRFTSSVTRTAGAAINAGNNVGVTVTGCDFTGMYDGIVYAGGTAAGNLAVVSGCYFTATINRGIVVDGANATVILEKTVMDTPGTQQVGLELLQCSSIFVDNCDFNRSVNNLRIAPTTGAVYSAYFTNVFFDDATGSSALIAGTGIVQRIKFTNCWFSASTIGCEFASTATTLPTAIDFINCDLVGNSGRGVYANGVQEFSISSSRIAGNTTAGVEVNASAGSVTKFALQNNAITATAGYGANGTGVLINAGTYGGYAMKNNDVRSNTTSNITDSGTVATTDLKIINDNFGHIITGSIGNLTAPSATSLTTITALLSVRVPARAVAVGQMFRFRLIGNSSSTGTLIFRVLAGATGTTSDAQAWQSTTSAAQAANQRAGFEGVLTVRSTGATGTVQAEGLGHAGTALLQTVVAAPTTPTVNTTNAWFITLAVTCSFGAFTAQQAVVEAL